MIVSKCSEIGPLPDETIDPFKDGRLRIIQSKTGYRFSIDAILLSDFVTIKKHETVVDLGTGCGVIPLSLLISKPLKHIYCLEIQPELAYQAIRNAKLNNFENKMSVIRGDMRNLPLPASSANVVVCNPPYRRKESGRINPDRERAIARHEIMASLDDILNAAGSILKAKGRLAMIYPADRLADLMTSMRQYNLEPKRIRIIYPNADSEAKLALVEGVSGGNSGVKILSPLFDQGSFSIPKNPD